VHGRPVHAEDNVEIGQHRDEAEEEGLLGAHPARDGHGEWDGEVEDRVWQFITFEQSYLIFSFPPFP